MHPTLSPARANFTLMIECMPESSGCYTLRTLWAASQASIQKKTNIMQIMTKNSTIFIYLIFYHREIVKLDHFMTLSLSYANTVL